MQRKCLCLLIACFCTWCMGISVLSAQLRKDTVNVYFASGSAAISAAEQQKLDVFLQRFDAMVVKGVVLHGFCDDRGDSLMNQELSIRRARAVRDQLVQRGVDSTDIKSVRGLGERPLVGNVDDNVERANNRMVRVVVQSGPKSTLLPDTLKVGDKITLHNIQFVGGRRVLLQQSVPAFKELVRALKEQPKYEVCILGYVCCAAAGSDGEDIDTGQMNLSETRAKTIHDYLIKNGIDPTRLSYKGMGNIPTGKGYEADRRVEVQVTGLRASR